MEFSDIADHRGQCSKDDGEMETKIRLRAYGIYLSRGGADGLDVEDWLKAEGEERG